MIDFRDWYDQRRQICVSLLKVVRPLLDTLVSNKGIHHLPVEARVKEYESFMGKKLRKNIDNPEEINDVLGLRVICFILSDVEKAKEVIEKNFNVIGRMDDKTEALGPDRFGYRSVHYIVSISANRQNLPEYENYKDLKFEIQIRTILQHAWAEIEHDRNYKSATGLPRELQREFSRLSAELESIDVRFQQLVDDTEKYRNSISQQTKEGKLDVDIDSVSIEGYFREKFGSEYQKRVELVDKDIIEELKSSGIKSLRDLDDRISKDREKYTRLAEITQNSAPRVAIADVYNSRDKKILRPRYLKTLFDLSHRDNTECVNEAEVLKNTGLGGYLEGIIPYVVADLEQECLIEICEEKGEIRLTQKGRDEVKKIP
jgi:putative GTP pyrophosphokinase